MNDEKSYSEILKETRDVPKIFVRIILKDEAINLLVLLPEFIHIKSAEGQEGRKQ